MRKLTISVLVVLSVLMLSCNEVGRDPSPVHLVATATQLVTVFDLGTGCDIELGLIELRAIQKNPGANPAFLGVQLERVRITYVRTDGGTMVPAPVVRTVSGFVEPGGTFDIPTGLGGVATLPGALQLFRTDAFQQAPFAALLPVNGGVDPETGRQSVDLDVIVEIFGETLSGENVSAQTRFPLTFCYNCGGCR